MGSVTTSRSKTSLPTRKRSVAQSGESIKLKSKARSSAEEPRSMDEIQFLDMAMSHLESMSAEEYREASEKLELIGNEARASY